MHASLGYRPLPGFYAPFDSPTPYYTLSLVLSAAVLLCLQILQLFIQRHAVIANAFASMLQVQRNRLRCFGVDVTLEPECARIKSSCVWTLRVMVVVVLCFLWQSTVLFQVTPHYKNMSLDDMEQFCRLGLTCFHYQGLSEILFRWTTKSITHLCSEEQHLLDITSGHATCLGIPITDSMSVTANVALAYSLYRLILASFEFVAWLVFRSRGHGVELCVTLLAVCTIVPYVVGLFIPWGFFYDTWFATVTYLSLPFILLTARQSGLAARAVRERRLKLGQKPALKGLEMTAPPIHRERTAAMPRTQMTSTTSLETQHGQKSQASHENLTN